MKTVQLQNLNEGDRFEIPSVQDTMKNLVVLRNSQCSVLVRGEKRDSVNDSWTNFRYSLAPTTNVIFVGKSNFKVQDGQIVEIMNTQEETVKVKGRRGRPKKSLDLKLPEGEWTVTDVASLNGCEKYDVTNYIKKYINSRIREVGTRKGLGKGKPSKVYRVS